MEGSEPETIPPTLPPGLTLREYLTDRIRNRSRWLEGRYGRDTDDLDHGVLLDSLQGPASTVIRRPPLAARRLLQESRRGTASLNEMAGIIESDPALLQSVLKHANSVFYASSVGGNPVVSVPSALHRMGFKGIEIVVMSHMVEGSLCRPGEGLNELAAAVWSHMVRVAPLARTLAPGFGVNPDECYAMGLLHDVGKLVLFNRVADLRKRVRRPVHLHPSFIPAALKELHGPLGGLAVLEWGLGETAAMAVAHHQRDPVPQPPSPLSEAIFLAERLDLLMEEEAEVRLEALWAEGSLTANLERIIPIWEKIRPEPEEVMEEMEGSSEGEADDGAGGKTDGSAEDVAKAEASTEDAAHAGAGAEDVHHQDRGNKKEAPPEEEGAPPQEAVSLRT